MTTIKEALVESNIWWKEEFNPRYHDRDIYADIAKYLPMPQIIALTGLRRVGKTTLMHKIIFDFIENKHDPGTIVYFSFDEFPNAELRDVIREYEMLTEKNIRTGKYLLLLDEVQKLNGWEDQLKRIYDNYRDNLKIIISGSESLFIRKKSKEALGGRIFEFRIDTLSFKEFLAFKGINFTPSGIYERELLMLLGEYSKTEGFPELIGVKDKEIILKYIKEGIVEKVIYRDIPRLFKVRDISTLDAILNILLDNPGHLIDLNNLSKELKISRQTASNYISYLEKSFLVRKLYNFSTGRRKIERKLKKYYPAVILDINFRDDDISRSKAFEWLIVTRLNSEFFWRDSYKNEVDIIASDKITIPVEIKHGKIDTTGLIAFMKKFNVNSGCIISYDREEELKIDNKYRIKVIPAFKFFLETTTISRPVFRTDYHQNIE